MTDTVAATLARADTAWRSFRDAARRVPAGRLTEERPGEWTRLAMLAHDSAWHRSAAERLRRSAATGPDAVRAWAAFAVAADTWDHYAGHQGELAD